ncbi:MAG TPA: hypothetical protein PKI44_00840 [Candidatus Omnitrophota bacterium]|nr:hypothetical protein [Candidatus Omnitrophota bacterium]
MKICRFCDKPIGDQDKICGNCGYNPQTDTMTASFIKKKNKVESAIKNNRVSSGVKAFAYWSLAVIIFSLGFQYQRKLGDLAWELKDILLGKRGNQVKKVSVKSSPSQSTRLIDVRSYKISAGKPLDKGIKVEGIFYDPQGKSYVVINDQLVSEQESFGAMLITKINSNSVEIIENGKVQVLTVSK